MSKLSKTLLIILTICVALALALGITYSVKKQEKEVDNTASAYEQLLEDLQRELNVSVQNVTELQLELDLKGLTIDDLTKTVTKYQTEVKTLKETVTFYETQIVEKDRVITEKETEIKEVEKQVTEYRDRIVELEADGEDNQEEIERLKGQIQELQNQIAEKDRTIADLRSELARMTDTKTQIETQVVEKERVITEKEQEIQEKEAENAQLVININVLNETIVNLNIRIELLEEALGHKDNANYLKDLIGSNLGSVIIDENYAFMWTDNPDLQGIYKVSLLDYSYEKVYDKENSFVPYKLTSGDIFFGRGGYGSFDGLLFYDHETEEFTLMFTGYANQAVYNLKDGNALIGALNYLNCPLKYFDVTTKQVTTFERPYDGNILAGIYEYDSGDLLLYEDYLRGNIYFFDIETHTCKTVFNYSDYDHRTNFEPIDGRYSIIYDTKDYSGPLQGLYVFDSTDCSTHQIDVHGLEHIYIPSGNSLEYLNISSLGIYLFEAHEHLYALDYVNNELNDLYTFEDSQAKEFTDYGSYAEIKKMYNDQSIYGYYIYATKQFVTELPEVLNISHYGVVMYYHDSVTTGHYPGYDDHATYSLVSSAYDGEEITISYQVFSGYKFKSFCYVTYPEGKPQYNFVAGQDGKFTVSKNMLHNGNVCIAMVIEQVN